jgi:hypothetical protein
MTPAFRKLEVAESRLRALQDEKSEPIAVIGMGCAFPAMLIRWTSSGDFCRRDTMRFRRFPPTDRMWPALMIPSACLGEM